MDRILSAVFWVVGLFDVRSSDPVLAAYRHARRALIIFMVAEFAFLGLASTFTPDGAIGVIKNAPIADQIRYYIGNGFAICAAACLLGMVSFAIRIMHVYLKPECYID